VTQGGDWGSYVTRTLGYFYPKHCKASHINTIPARQPKWSKNPILALQHAITPYSEKTKAGLARSRWFVQEGRAYYMEHATKPQTIAYALNDSPVALLAWIYEKLHDWTDSYPWTDEEIFTWISIYQFSRAGPGATLRIYYEFTHTQPGPKTITLDQILSYIPQKLGMGMSIFALSDSALILR
jgi:hypothetical protein